MRDIDAAALDDTRMEAPTWEHCNITIKPFMKKLHTPTVDPDHSIRAYFGDSCKPSMRLGGGGYLLYGVNGTLLSMAVHYYGHASPTNNVAKAKATKDYL